MEAVTSTPTSEKATMSNKLVPVPTTPRADCPKARIFTFEGLTPVSTIDDAREDTAVAAGSPEQAPAVRDSGFDTCSPLTIDNSMEQEEAVPDKDCMVNKSPIVRETSSVKEKVAAWERQTTNWRGPDDYEVPFDEEPMSTPIGLRPEAEKIVDLTAAAAAASTESPPESITETPVDDKDTSCHTSMAVADVVSENSPEVPFSAKDAAEVPTVAETARSTKETKMIVDCEHNCDTAFEGDEAAVTMAASNLLDQEDDTEIAPSPTDEEEDRCHPVDGNNDPGEPSPDCNNSRSVDLPASSAALAEVGLFGCNDEICTQVSTFLASNTTVECCGHSKP